MRSSEGLSILRGPVWQPQNNLAKEKGKLLRCQGIVPGQSTKVNNFYPIRSKREGSRRSGLFGPGARVNYEICRAAHARHVNIFIARSVVRRTIASRSMVITACPCSFKPDRGVPRLAEAIPVIFG